MSDDDLMALSPQQVTLTDSDAEVAPGSVERGIVSRSSSPRPASSPSPGPLLRRRSPSPAKSIPSSDGVRTVIDFVPDDAEKIEYKGKCWTLYGANKWLRSKDLHYAVQEVQFATRVGWPFAILACQTMRHIKSGKEVTIQRIVIVHRARGAELQVIVSRRASSILLFASPTTLDPREHLLVGHGVKVPDAAILTFLASKATAYLAKVKITKGPT